MNETEFKAIQADNAIIAKALLRLAQTDPSLAVSKRARELRRRFLPFSMDEYFEAIRKLRRHAISDARNSTSIQQEMELMASRALEMNAELVKDLSSKSAPKE
jgi:hypothetical protein